MMSRTRHLERDERRTERAQRQNLAAGQVAQMTEREQREARRAEQHAAEIERAEARRTRRVLIAFDVEAWSSMPEVTR